MPRVRKSKTSKLLIYFLCASMMVSLVTLGYAALTTDLWIQGSVEAKALLLEGLYIEEVSLVSITYAADTLHEHIYPTNLKTELNVGQANATVTYKITVYNKTDVTYWYLGILQDATYEENNLINQADGIFITTKDHESDTAATFDTSDWVPPQTRRNFYVTYRFGSKAKGGGIENLVNFHFGLLMDSVKDEFLKILNDKTSNNGYDYLADAFDNRYAETGSDTIANLGDEAAVFDKLFGPNITVNVNGVATPVTIMVQRKNVDSNGGTGDKFDGAGAPSGCEYTVYITTESPDGSSVTVHAVSYTCGPDGVWYQLGQLYEGTCNTAPYVPGGEAAFDVNSWDATAKKYEVTDKISYEAGFEQGDQFDKLDSIEELMSTYDQNFYNDINNNSSQLLQPVCQTLYSYQHVNGQWVESANAENSFKPGYDYLLKAFSKIKPYCYIGNGAQEVKIQNASSITRAQLIPLLQEVQMAYDYYLSVN